MRRLMRPALLLLLVAIATLPAIADKVKDLYAKGQDAEARQHYEVAYGFFKQCYDLKPKDLRYRAAFERVRFEAAASIVHNGQKLREDGKLDEAVAEFQKALAIDPSLFIAKQELNRTLKMINDLRNPQPQAAGPPAGLERRIHDAAGPVELAPISNIPITVKLTDKSDTVYRTIGQLAGINVLFDPDYTPKQIKVELNGVTLEEALEITALESKTFWRPVTLNTIFVATDNPAKRKELEQSVLKTFYLTNLSAPTELQDVVNAIRAVLDVQRVQQLLSQNALVVRGTPDQIALAEKLVEDLDKARPHRGHASQQRQVAHAGTESADQRHHHPAGQHQHDHDHHHHHGHYDSDDRHGNVWDQPEHAGQPERHELPGRHSLRQPVGGDE
jgi:general secretion pathway protein D